MQIKNLLAITAIIVIFQSCDAQVNTTPEVPFQVASPDAFADYWYQGEAELNHYDLEQARYGEVRGGEAVMIFVTEDFLKEKQVKKEFGDAPATTILKLNFLKKFITGIYDYSIMTSIFTPVDFFAEPMSQKVTFSSQDWCGQSFSQMNLRNQEMEFQVRSYFQNEGDTTLSFPATYIEDDIWNRIRLEPQTLPLGKIDMVPSHEYLRLLHKPVKSYKAEAHLVLQVNDSKTNPEFYVYTLKYPDLDRQLVIHCESRFPFKIKYWEETLHASDPTKKQVTKGRLTQTLQNSYWELNANKNETLRDSLGLHYKME